MISVLASAVTAICIFARRMTNPATVMQNVMNMRIAVRTLKSWDAVLSVTHDLEVLVAGV